MPSEKKYRCIPETREAFDAAKVGEWMLNHWWHEKLNQEQRDYIEKIEADYYLGLITGERAEEKLKGYLDKIEDAK